MVRQNLLIWCTIFTCFWNPFILGSKFVFCLCFSLPRNKIISVRQINYGHFARKKVVREFFIHLILVVMLKKVDLLAYKQNQQYLILQAYVLLRDFKKKKIMESSFCPLFSTITAGVDQLCDTLVTKGSSMITLMKSLICK